ncbi:MAG: glycosyltransferase family 4 protein [Solirubrobacteraceae bacterium]
MAKRFRPGWMSATAASAVAGKPEQIAKGGLVMLCDVDLGLSDATRTHTVGVARGFTRAGLDVHLVARGHDPALPGVRYAAARGGEHQRLTRLATINLQATRLLWSRRRAARRFYLRANWSCFPATVIARALGYHVVMQVDGVPYGPGSPEGRGLAGLMKLLVAIAMGRLCHGVLAVTPEIERLLIRVARIPPERISVIPNGVDVEFFVPLRREEAIRRSGLDPACRYLVFCGGLYPWTDFPTMLNAFAAVVSAEPDARMVLVGDGPEREPIERHARGLGVADRVILTGRVSDRERIRDYLGAATVALLAYRIERVRRAGGSPIKLMEYLAAGRAVVGLELPGLRELIEGNQAGLVVPCAADALADAIVALLDPAVADRHGAAGRRYAEAHLSWDSIVQRTLVLFRLSVDGR